VQIYKTAIQNINHSYTQIPCNSNNQLNTKFSKLHIFLEIWSIAALLLLVNPLNTKLNPICHLLALLGAHHILHVSRIRVNTQQHNQDTDHEFLLL